MQKLDIKSLNREEIAEWISKNGYPSFRASQIFLWLQKGVASFDEMANLPSDLRKFLNEHCYIAVTKIETRLESKKDGTVKYLFRLFDGEYIETVLMKYKYGYTVCISTQVGCRMGCKFCATGLSGLKRNLTASEMLSQVKTAEIDNNVRISHIVMMGMGEPLDNYDNSVKFLRLVSSDEGMNIGLRNISLSTSGIVSGIKKLSEEGLPITLSVSLHAPNDEIRNSIMPVNNKWNVDSLLSACRDYIKATKRRISFEYALIDGVNNTDECAVLLAKKLKNMLCHVNLIPANPVAENGFKKPDRKKTEHFMNLLIKNGINATVRRTLGSDIDASCGQLRGQHIKKEVARIENSK